MYVSWLEFVLILPAIALGTGYALLLSARAMQVQVVRDLLYSFVNHKKSVIQ